ncbi:MAG: DUF6498-containing protein [Akkermansiaceae bacterium]
MKSKVSVSLIILILVNLLPIFGVIYAGWDVFEIVALYWFENVVIGLVNVLKIITCCPGSHRSASTAIEISKLFKIPFFTIHYGGFCFVHGIFVFGLLGPKNKEGGHGDPFENMGHWFSSFVNTDVIWFVLAIVASHIFSFFKNYIGENEYTRSTPDKLMNAPYGRVVVLHLAIIGGGFIVQELGSSVGMLILLIIGKIIIDAKLHLRSHQKLEEKL